MNCKLHTDREAVAGCISCGNMLCAECDVPTAGKHHCKACLAQAVTAQPGPALSPAPRSAMGTRRLLRSRSELMLAGVCGGIAAYLDCDPALIRLATIILAFVGGAGLIAYAIAWIVIPLESSELVVTEL